LHLFEPETPQQLRTFHALCARYPPLIKWYLRAIVLPLTMKRSQAKLTASGQELGGDVLFGTRLGFSGTPSALIPPALGSARYEAETEGRILSVLSSRQTVSVTVLRDWTVRRLLQAVASGPTRFHALIDTGALITGHSNQQVARLLLDLGLYVLSPIFPS
jgi:hypothetical protein